MKLLVLLLAILLVGCESPKSIQPITAWTTKRVEFHLNNRYYTAPVCIAQDATYPAALTTNIFPDKKKWKYFVVVREINEGDFEEGDIVMLYCIGEGSPYKSETFTSSVQ